MSNINLELRSLKVEPYAEEIIRLYLEENKSVSYIAETYGVNNYHISNVLEKNKIKVRLHPNRYKCNHGFFKLPFTREEQFYWLGFIIADGCIYEKGHVLKIKLSTIDKQHLEKFLSHLGCESPIKDITAVGKKTGYVSQLSVIEVYSTQLYADLISCGVVPNKTKHGIILRPEFIKNNHFWRGYFDGDGSIRRLISKGSLRWDVYFTGCQDVITSIRELITKLTGSLVKVQDMGNWSRVMYCHNQISQYIIIYLYNNATVWLDRKKKLADELIISEFDTKEQRRIASITCEKFNEIYDQLGNVIKTARYFNIGQGTAYKINKDCRDSRRN